MTPTLLPERHFIGKFIQSPINTASTQELWKSFMPLRKQINAISEELFSVIVPTEDTRKSGQLTMHSTVDKWAAVEVDPSYPTPENLVRLNSSLIRAYRSRLTRFKFRLYLILAIISEIGPAPPPNIFIKRNRLA